MGTYIYKVTAKKVGLTNGQYANVAVFAYKPYFWDKKWDHKMKLKSGCYVAERYVGGKNYTGQIVLGFIEDDGTIKIGSTVAKKCTDGYFEDNEFASMETVGEPINYDPT